jgi:peroxiredoxin Q/BCP
MIKTIVFILLTSVFTIMIQAEPLNVGDTAPSITSISDNGGKIDLDEVYQKGLVLIYFYPKADTPGCTIQSCNLRDEFTALTDKNIIVIGISADTVTDQNAFKVKYDLPFTLLADKDGDVIKAFGVPTRPSGSASRQSFLIKDGIVVWRDLEATPKTQAEDALKALENL